MFVHWAGASGVDGVLVDRGAHGAIENDPEAVPVVPAGTVAGGQDDSGRIARLAQPRRHLEPVDAGKLNIEQHLLRPQPLRLGDSRLTISGLAHDPDASRLQQRTGDLPEALVVVDDQDS